MTTTGEGGLSATTTLTVLVSPTILGPSYPDTGHLVISQVYGGGGNSGATYKNDFIELFNPTTTNINLSGYAVEYFSAAGNSGGKTVLSGTVKAGGYFLIQEAAGTGGTQALPTPDATGTLNMAAANGAVSLSNSGTVIDLVGFGTATKFEGAATPALSNTNSAQRGGCVDTDNNRADFTVTVAAPRNSASPLTICQ